MNPPPSHHHYAAHHPPYIPPTPPAAAVYTNTGVAAYPLPQTANPTTHYYPQPYATIDTATAYPSYAAVNHQPSSSSSTVILPQNALYPIPKSHSVNPSIPQPDRSAVLYSDEDYVRRLRNEVIFLHGLWHQGPPNSNSHSSSNSTDNPVGNLHLKAAPSTAFKKKKNKKNNPRPRPVSDKPWPVPPEPPARPESESAWPEFRPRPAASTRVATEEEKARIWAIRVQQNGLDRFRSFFAGKHESDYESGSEEDEDDEFDYYFSEVFEGNEEMRSYYEKNWENGEFLCLVCGGIGHKIGRKYKNCVALVQHTATISKTKKRAAHRAYGQVICKVLGWDINRLPSILVNPSDQQGIDIGSNAESHKDDFENVEANIGTSVNKNEQSDPSKDTSDKGEDDTAEQKETSNLPLVLANPGVQQLTDKSMADTCKNNSDSAEENTAAVLNVHEQADSSNDSLDSGDANATVNKETSILPRASTGCEGDNADKYATWI